MPGALAIVQARMSSSRLPGKSLADIEGEPLLGLVLRRLSRACALERIVVTTSTDEIDDQLAGMAVSAGVEVHHGPRDDVLTRFIEAAGDHAGPIVRITGDCPFVEPGVVDAVVRRFDAARAAVYASNVAPRSYPKGLDVEVMSPGILARVAREATAAEDREHVTTLIRRDPGRFPAVNVRHHVDLSDLRWTIDYEDDLQFVRAVIRRLGIRRHDAGLDEILAAIRASPPLTGCGGNRG